MRSRTTGIIVACVLAAAGLSGCKTTTTTSTAGGGPTQPVAGQSTTPGPVTASATDGGGGGNGGGGTTADGLGHPAAVCSLLPVADMAQLTGEPLTTSKEADLPLAKAYTCVYNDAIGTDNTAVTVLALNAAVSFNAGITVLGAGATPISGVGDKAYSAVIGVFALFGNVEISVTGVDDTAAAVKIIQTLQPKL